MEFRYAIREAIASVCRQQAFEGQCADSKLKPAIAEALEKLGFEVDIEDRKKFLKAGMYVWREKVEQKKWIDWRVVPTAARRKIDLVVYQRGTAAALIETESDLNDLVNSGVKRRNGHYDVASIASSDSGVYFNSYKSLERMAAAAFYFSRHTIGDEHSDPAASLAGLQAIRSDSPADHNPLGLPLFLVTGNCRTGKPIDDSAILLPRLQSLGAELIAANQF